MNTLLTLSLGFIAMACSSDNGETPEPPVSSVTITTDKDALAFETAGGEAGLNVKADKDWSIMANDSWCSVFPSGGLKNESVTVKVTVTASSSSEKRSTTLTIVSGSTRKTVSVTQNPKPVVEVSKATVCFGAQASKATVNVTGNQSWTATVADSWLSINPATGNSGNSTLEITATANTSGSSREATIEITSEAKPVSIKVVQYSDEVVIPEGYTLVWADEFNDPAITQPDPSKWWYEEWAPGFVNNELQRYVPGSIGSVKTAEIKDGILSIIATKAGSEVVSARINTKELWQYGWFEARLKLPKGKGTWPAFWMMPAEGNNWPMCGEIDIMEEVGVNPNYTSSSVHTKEYNHMIGTQKTAERLTPGAEDEFHVYALEWTADYIKTYVDGKLLFTFMNDKAGRQETWPFDKPFHPILNLAWGGSWGGMKGVDESALPAVYQIDYVRVFQK